MKRQELREKLRREGKEFLRKCFALKPQARWSADMLPKNIIRMSELKVGEKQMGNLLLF